jgi:hypothetical protein
MWKDWPFKVQPILAASRFPAGWTRWKARSRAGLPAKPFEPRNGG